MCCCNAFFLGKVCLMCVCDEKWQTEKCGEDNRGWILILVRLRLNQPAFVVGNGGTQ